MKAVTCHVQIDKKGKINFPSNVALPSGEAEVIFLFPEVKTGNQLSKFAGCVNDKEAHEVMTMVEEGCERIEQNGW